MLGIRQTVRGNGRVDVTIHYSHVTIHYSRRVTAGRSLRIGVKRFTARDLTDARSSIDAFAAVLRRPPAARARPVRLVIGPSERTLRGEGAGRQFGRVGVVVGAPDGAAADAPTSKQRRRDGRGGGRPMRPVPAALAEIHLAATAAAAAGAPRVLRRSQIGRVFSGVERLCRPPRLRRRVRAWRAVRRELPRGAEVPQHGSVTPALLPAARQAAQGGGRSGSRAFRALLA